MTALLPLAAGFLLDLWWGDPLWLPHPVVAIGRLTSLLEKVLRRLFPGTPQGGSAAGVLLAAVVPVVSGAAAWLLLWLLRMIHPLLGLAGSCFLSYQILATRCLAQSAKAVYGPLRDGDLSGARAAVGRIVGRDTERLGAADIARAAVETVAENTSDGVVAPMLFLALGGVPLAMAYKAVNTLDSMVGYKNERYLHFGRASARLDDWANFIPARLSGALMVLAAAICGYSGTGAFRVLARDRLNHTSPNAGHTEAACAGALGIALGGAAHYGGRLVEKPRIGDAARPIEPEDILRANRLLYATALICFGLCLLIRLGLIAVGLAS